MNDSSFVAPIINQLIAQMVYILPALLFITIIKTAWFKGKIGEFWINTNVKIRLDENVYHLIKNVTLPTDDGSTQIDHIVVSVYGVFVIETKNMKGWIFGGERQRTWTQKLFKESYKFQNPLFQNFKHTQTLKTLLQLSDEQIHSVVAFTGESTFKTPMPENVTQGSGYIRYIKSKTKLVLPESGVQNIIAKIEQERLTPSFKTDRQHIKQLDKKYGKHL
jgi:hypothetical protein